MDQQTAIQELAQLVQSLALIVKGGYIQDGSLSSEDADHLDDIARHAREIGQTVGNT